MSKTHMSLANKPAHEWWQDVSPKEVTRTTFEWMPPRADMLADLLKMDNRARAAAIAWAIGSLSAEEAVLEAAINEKLEEAILPLLGIIVDTDGVPIERCRALKLFSAMINADCGPLLSLLADKKKILTELLNESVIMIDATALLTACIGHRRCNVSEFSQAISIAENFAITNRDTVTIAKSLELTAVVLERDMNNVVLNRILSKLGIMLRFYVRRADAIVRAALTRLLLSMLRADPARIALIFARDHVYDYFIALLQDEDIIADKAFGIGKTAIDALTCMIDNSTDCSNKCMGNDDLKRIMQKLVKKSQHTDTRDWAAHFLILYFGIADGIADGVKEDSAPLPPEHPSVGEGDLDKMTIAALKVVVPSLEAVYSSVEDASGETVYVALCTDAYPAFAPVQLRGVRVSWFCPEKNKKVVIPEDSTRPTVSDVDKQDIETLLHSNLVKPLLRPDFVAIGAEILNERALGWEPTIVCHSCRVGFRAKGLPSVPSIIAGPSGKNYPVVIHQAATSTAHE